MYDTIVVYVSGQDYRDERLCYPEGACVKMCVRERSGARMLWVDLTISTSASEGASPFEVAWPLAVS